MKSNNIEGYETIELYQERDRICQKCVFFYSCSEKRKEAPYCRIISDLYNKRCKEKNE